MLKRICKEQYEKDFDEMFKLDKKGLMTDIHCYVENLENKNERLDLLYKGEAQKNEISRYEIKALQQRIDKAIDILGNFDAWLEPQDTQKIRKCIEILKGDNND